MEKIISPISNIVDELKEQLKKSNITNLREMASNHYPADLAEALETFEIKDIVLLLRFFSTESSAEIFTYLSNATQEKIIQEFNSNEIKKLFEEIYTDEIVEILEELPSNIVKKVLRSTTPESRLDINHILNYEEDTAGSIMSVDFLNLKTDQTVIEAITQIKEAKDDVEEVSDFYVVDTLNNLKGYVDIRTLFFSKENVKIEDIMKDRVVFAYTNTDQEEVTNLFKKYSLNNMPIINSENKLVGIVTIDDVIEVIDEEATEDIHKMAGIAPVEDTYFKINIWKMVRSRISSLLFLMLSTTITQIIITIFVGIYLKKDIRDPEAFEVYYVLTVLLTPLITVLSSTSGIAGGQSSTMVIRSLALNEMQNKDYFKMIWKELRVGLICALIVSGTNVVRMILVYLAQYQGSINETALWETIATISVSMFLAIVFSKLIGGSLPFLAKKIKLDPAAVTTPIVTTIIDIISTTTFFSIGLLFIQVI